MAVSSRLSDQRQEKPDGRTCLSRQHGTMSRCRLEERSRCRDATSTAGVMCSVRKRGACPCTADNGRPTS